MASDRPRRWAVTLPYWPWRMVFGPQSDIPSVLDACWEIAMERRYPVEVIER